MDLKYALSSCRGQLLESGVRSKRAKREVLELKNFKNREISFLRRDLVYCTYEQNVMAWPSHARQTSCTWACPRRPSSASSQSRVRQIHLRRGSLGTDTRSVRCAVTTAAVAAHQPRAGSLSKVRQIPLRRGNLDMDARCAGAAAAIAILLLLP